MTLSDESDQAGGISPANLKQEADEQIDASDDNTEKEDAEESNVAEQEEKSEEISEESNTEGQEVAAAKSVNRTSARSSKNKEV